MFPAGGAEPEFPKPPGDPDVHPRLSNSVQALQDGAQPGSFPSWLLIFINMLKTSSHESQGQDFNDLVFKHNSEWSHNISIS